MNRLVIPTVAAMSLLATVAFAPTAAVAKHRCDNPSSSVDTRACRMAAEGPDVLRTFVLRTRMIYGLYYFDYAPRDDQSAAGSATMPPVAFAVSDSKPVAIKTNPR